MKALYDYEAAEEDELEFKTGMSLFCSKIHIFLGVALKHFVKRHISKRQTLLLWLMVF